MPASEFFPVCIQMEGQQFLAFGPIPIAAETRLAFEGGGARMLAEQQSQREQGESDRGPADSFGHTIIYLESAVMALVQGNLDGNVVAAPEFDRVANQFTGAVDRAAIEVVDDLVHVQAISQGVEVLVIEPVPVVVRHVVF